MPAPQRKFHSLLAPQVPYSPPKSASELLERIASHQRRAVAAQLAYDLRVQPSGSAIKHGVVRTELLYTFKRLLDTEDPENHPLLADEPYDVLDWMAASLLSGKPRSNTYHKQLLGKRPASEKTRNADLALCSPDALNLDGHILWPVMRTRPGNLVDYFVLGQHLPSWTSAGLPSAGTEPIDLLPGPTALQCKTLLKGDSPASLSFALLLLGAARSPGWERYFESAKREAIGIACRLACVPPFAHFGEEFALDVIGTSLAYRSDFRELIEGAKRRIAHYRAILNAAYTAEVLARDYEGGPGDRWKELALLKIVDKAPRGKDIGAALRLKANSGTVSRTCNELPPQLERVAPPRNPWQAPGPSILSFSRGPPPKSLPRGLRVQ